MKKTCKRGAAILLCATMVLNLAVTPALAQDVSGSIQGIQQKTTGEEQSL